MTTEITIYEKNGKTYCQECKPKGGKRGTLVLSGVDHYCDGCGKDFLGEDGDDLSPEDLAAIEHAMSQEDTGPYTMAELTAMVEQAQHDTATCDCNPCRATRKQQAQQAERERVSRLASSSMLTPYEQQWMDNAYARAVALARPFEVYEVFRPIWDAGVELTPQMDSRFVLVQEATGKTARLWGVKPAPQPEPKPSAIMLTGLFLEPCGRCHVVQTRGRCQQCNRPLCLDCANIGRGEMLVCLACHVQFIREVQARDGLAPFCQAVAMYASQQIDPFDLDCESVWDWQKADRAFMEWEVKHPKFVAIV